MRVAILCLCLSGCASGLDEAALSGISTGDLADPGLGPGGGPTTDGGVGPVDLSAPPPGPNRRCDDFGPVQDGTLPPGWNEARGTWRIATDGATKVLRQESAPSQRKHDDYIVWTGDKGWRDVEISARVTTAGERRDDCLLVRYKSPDAYYALCMEGQQNQSNPNAWELSRVNDGDHIRLTGGSLKGNSPTHDLGLKIVGTTLTATIDGEVQAPVTDGNLGEGAVGLSSEGPGRFSGICLGTL